MNLTGKVAVVTGGSGDIGGAIARQLHGQGATVAISGTRIEPLEALAAELGERVHVTPCNLSDAAAVDALPKQAAEHHRRELEHRDKGDHPHRDQHVAIAEGNGEPVATGDNQSDHRPATLQQVAAQKIERFNPFDDSHQQMVGGHGG